MDYPNLYVLELLGIPRNSFRKGNDCLSEIFFWKNSIVSLNSRNIVPVCSVHHRVVMDGA